ncbi:hypothetical protein FPZ43_17365 [Mucilaginibacter pallidiroseus]|uniref:Uncharacterized protein n=1 Tax=Mucilaginibacter pallidiroseus TaxID=2599295 RepID=A0A563U2F4_9SPHI|nr:hypothetical protein [Mucilaginibacter pallidiroseus]TWR25239.1 hypothetical protein FPZ43_17365 [Mucilaginibacter pallidiroseus]
MELIFISNQIKYDILQICGMPAKYSYNLLGNISLSSIGYRDDAELCRRLESKLQLIAEEYKTGCNIPLGSVSGGLTVSQCIRLVVV